MVISNDCDSSTSTNNNEENIRLARKEQSRSRKSDNDEIPAKIPKTTVGPIKSNGNHVNKPLVDDDDIFFIEECTSTSNPPTSKQQLVKPKSDAERVLDEVRKEMAVLSAIEITSTSTEKPSSKQEIEIIPDIIDITDTEDNEVVVKEEPMQVDVGERASINSKASTVDLNIKQEPQSDADTSSTPVKVKQEPNWSCFADVDIVEIDDADDSIFPISQLFDKTPVKQECEDSNEDELPHLSQFLADDDDNLITILDSDDESEMNVDNDFMHIIPKIKVEPGLELPDEQKSEARAVSPTASDEVPDMSAHTVFVPANEEIDSREQSKPATEITDEKSVSLEEQPPSENEDPLAEASTSKDTSVTNKTKRKGPEIIEPHFMKPRTRTAKLDKPEKKTKSRSKDKEESEKKHSGKKKGHSSDSSKKSSRDKSKEASSKSKKHKKDKEDRPSSSSSKKSSHSEHSRSKSSRKHGDDKYKSSSSHSSEKQKESKDKDTNEKDISNEIDSKNDAKTAAPDTSSENQTKPRARTTIVKVKVSSRTRGDMLCDSMQTLRPKPRTDPKKSSSSSETTKKDATKPDGVPSFVIPRRQVPSSSTPFSSVPMASRVPLTPAPTYSTHVPSQAPSLSTPAYYVPAANHVPLYSAPTYVAPMTSRVPLPSTSNTSARMEAPLPVPPPSFYKEITSAETTNEASTMDDVPSPTDSVEGSSTNFPHAGAPEAPTYRRNIGVPEAPAYRANAGISEVSTNHANTGAPEASMPLKSLLVAPSLLNATQKKVSFKENIVAVREFNIEDGHQMRNIRDGLGLRSTKKDLCVYKALELKIEDFLARVFAWEPLWLEQQQEFKTLPPIVDPKDKQELPDTCNSFEQYYRRMEVLLLLETWAMLVKEYECTGDRYVGV